MRHISLSLILFLLIFSFLFRSYAAEQVPIQSGQGATITLSVEPTWIPTDTNHCEITVSITGDAPNSHITFQLHSSNWPGTCMNFGDKRDLSADLIFVKSDNTSTDGIKNGTPIPFTWHASTDGSAITVKWSHIDNHTPEPFVVKVRSRDFGSVGKVAAGLYIGDSGYSTAEGSLPVVSGNAVYIAAHQKTKAGWVGWDGTDNEDDESGPEDVPKTEANRTSNSYNGDGITAFEEYRGFYVGNPAITGQPVHTRTSPNKRDIYLYTELSTYGFGRADALPSIFQLYHVSSDLMGGTGDRVMNRHVCKPFYKMNQKALWIRGFNGVVAGKQGLGGDTEGRVEAKTEDNLKYQYIMLKINTTITQCGHPRSFRGDCDEGVLSYSKTPLTQKEKNR